MYYPYLRARQFELIALRELSIEGATQGCICPILEPVKESYSNLNLAYTIFQQYEQGAYLVVNSLLGELAGDNNQYLEYLAGLNQITFLPAFHYNKNAEYIRSSIEQFNLNNCMVICQNDLSFEDEDFKNLIKLSQISAINVADPKRNRSIDRFLKGLKKTYIRLDDLFEKQLKNSSFLDIEQHRFSEEHLYFEEEGFNGFSDYTVLPSEYTEGGSTPRAVVIHLTYLNGESQIWIRHFTSVSNDSIANVQGKFAEAAEKAVTFCREHNLTNSAIQELEDFFDKEHYPGLGIVKKISIKNHLLIVGQYLRTKNI
jgi:hypothetical protein